MNHKSMILAVACAGLLWPGATRALADDDDAPAPQEKVVTDVAVQTGKITSATLHGYVLGYGRVEPAPATMDQAAAGAPLAAPSAGIVTKVNIVEGQPVTNGEVLVELNSEAAEAEAVRQEKLYEQQNTSLKNLQEAQAQLSLLRVTAPLAGTVVSVSVKPGQAVDLSTVVAEVMDLNRLAVSAEIPVAEAGGLKPGDPLEVLAETNVTAKILFVSPQVNKDNDTVLVRALLPAENGLCPGQFVSLRITAAVHADCLAVPGESVVTDESGKSVIALIKNGEAVQMAVQTGLRENGLVEVAAPGLQAGDVIVTTGAYGLPEKTKVHVENSADGEGSSTNPAGAK
jgi:membrane fusion protein, multidrug efflux system